MTTNIYTVDEVQLPGGPACAIREQHSMADLPDFFGGAFGELAGYLDEQAAQLTGPPFARYYSVSESAVDVEAVFPCDRGLPGRGRIRLIELLPSAAAQVLHVGPYQDLRRAWAAIEAWLAEHHSQRTDAPREVYLNGPDDVSSPAEFQTLVIQPIR